MASYGFSLDVREPLNRFSVAMQQIVAICRAIDLSAKVLILDEPTASLDTRGGGDAVHPDAPAQG